MSQQYLILVSRFNDLVTRSLQAGAQSTLEQAGVSQETVWVPGAFELPVAAATAAASGRYKAVICLGAVIKGDTPHFDHVAGQCASGLMKVSLDAKIPVIFGVLTTNTVEEALNRSGLKLGNKGSESAQAALDMVSTLEALSVPGGRS